MTTASRSVVRRQRHGRLDPLSDQLADGLVRKDRNAEIALANSGQPAHELDCQRIIETELLAHGIDLQLGSVVAHNDGGRIAR